MTIMLMVYEATNPIDLEVNVTSAFVTECDHRGYSECMYRQQQPSS